MDAPEMEFRNRYKPDYSGMIVRELSFCTMEDYSGNREEYKLDLITKRQAPENALPVVLFIHGGGFVKPNDKRQAYISVFARELTNAGYAVVSPDYPQFEDNQQLAAMGGESAGYAKAAEAIHFAYQFLRKNADAYQMDASRIAIIGGSAGGWAAFYAISNYDDRYTAFINCWGAPQKLPDVAGFPPTLSIHGTADTLVPYSLELAAQEAMERNGIPHKLITLYGCGHTPLDRKELFMPSTLNWINQSCRMEEPQ